MSSRIDRHVREVIRERRPRWCWLVLALALLLACVSVFAGSIGSSGSHVAGLPTHDHSSAAKGGTTISSATLVGTTTNSGTISGGTVSGVTLSGTTTNSGTISGGTVSGVTLSAGTGAFSGAVSSTKACASGYTRIGPNFCARNQSDSTAYTMLIREVCTTVARPTAEAKALLVSVYGIAAASAVEGSRFASVQAGTTSTCAVYARDVVFASTYENLSAPAGVALQRDMNEVVIPVDGAGNIYLGFNDDTGNQGGAGYKLVGYFD